MVGLFVIAILVAIFHGFGLHFPRWLMIVSIFSCGCLYFFEECLFGFFGLFLISLFIFELYGFFVYILNSSSLSDMYFAKISSQFLCYHFLDVLWSTGKLILMMSNLFFSFSCVVCCFPLIHNWVTVSMLDFAIKPYSLKWVVLLNLEGQALH